jgi:hypothetical protein
MKAWLFVPVLVLSTLACSEPFPYPEKPEADAKAASTRVISGTVPGLMRKAAKVAIDKGFSIAMVNETLGIMTCIQESQMSASFGVRPGQSVPSFKDTISLQFEKTDDSHTSVTMDLNTTSQNLVGGTVTNPAGQRWMVYNLWLDLIEGKEPQIQKQK